MLRFHYPCLCSPFAPRHSVQGLALWTLQHWMYVTAIGYSSTKFFRELQEREKAPWDGFMASNSTGSMALNFTLLSMTVEKYGACACPGQCGWPKLESYETPNKRYFRESVCWQRVCFQKAIWETPGYRCRANHQTEEEYKKTEHDAFHRLASLAEACYDRVSQWLFEEYLPD